MNKKLFLPNSGKLSPQFTIVGITNQVEIVLKNRLVRSPGLAVSIRRTTKANYYSIKMVEVSTN